MSEPFTTIVLATVLGVGLGTATGLVPGLHVNTIAPGLVALGLLTDAPFAATAGILATATTHTILNVIPTLAAPIPDEETSLLLLPIQQLARAGHAGIALEASVRASWRAGIVACVLVLVALWAAPSAPRPAPALTIAVVTGVVAMMILRHPRGPYALVVLLASGAVGYLLLDVTLAGPFGGDGSPLLAVLTGFFGFPMLWLVLRDQTDSDTTSDSDGSDDSPGSDPEDEGPTCPSWWAHATGMACGIMVSLFPGLTSATAGAFGRALRPSPDELEEVAMISAVDTANAVGNVGALLLWDAQRSGATIAVARVAGTSSVWGRDVLGLLLACTLASVGLASWMALTWGPRLVATLRRVPPRRAAWAGVLILASIVLVGNGPGGLLVAALVTPLGLLPHRWQVPRALLMGVLLVPYLVAVHGG